MENYNVTFSLWLLNYDFPYFVKNLTELSHFTVIKQKLAKKSISSDIVR